MLAKLGEDVPWLLVMDRGGVGGLSCRLHPATPVARPRTAQAVRSVKIVMGVPCIPVGRPGHRPGVVVVVVLLEPPGAAPVVPPEVPPEVPPGAVLDSVPEVPGVVVVVLPGAVAVPLGVVEVVPPGVVVVVLGGVGFGVVVVVVVLDLGAFLSWSALLQAAAPKATAMTMQRVEIRKVFMRPPRGVRETRYFA